MNEKRILIVMAIVALGTVTITSTIDFLEADARSIPNTEKTYKEYKENPTCGNITKLMENGINGLKARDKAIIQWILMECWK